MELPTKENHYLVMLPFFPGFYDSILSSAIDSAEERDAEYYAERECCEEDYQPKHLRISESEYAELFFKHTDYAATYLQVAKLWVGAFNEWCHENLELPNNAFALESMTSPKEYNFATDRLFAWVPIPVVELLFEKSKSEGHTTLAQVITESFTSYSGFMSFYSNDSDEWLEKPLMEWDHNELGTLVAAAIKSSGEYEDRSKFSWEIYEMLFRGNSEDACEVDWSKFKESVATLRSNKQAEHDAALQQATNTGSKEPYRALWN